MRHNCIRDFLTSQLDRVCHNVQIEPHLLPLDGENLRLRTAISGDDARLDMQGH